ncbi:hypothetical protein L6164_016506 [Bauhinia variegata]|uniref:Uncharacterized protein n=1 Tax=Bauhinia variegata TaxID=167791 RepID=A0ACB9NR51_BAUVA|nr:hypothetical protein L6164_016506 [Bauhinia variegata]
MASPRRQFFLVALFIMVSNVHNLTSANPPPPPSHGEVWQSYEFHFRPNFWGTTLFYCSVTWSKGSVSYEAYEYYRDCYRGRCPKRCVWKVTKDGILGYADTKPPKHDATIFWNGGPPR